MGRKYQFMESNMQRRIVGLDDKMPDIQKTLETVRFLKTRKVRDVWFGWCGELSSDNLIAWLGSDWGYIWVEWYALCEGTYTTDWGSIFVARGGLYRVLHHDGQANPSTGKCHVVIPGWRSRRATLLEISCCQVKQVELRRRLGLFERTNYGWSSNRSCTAPLANIE